MLNERKSSMITSFPPTFDFITTLITAIEPQAVAVSLLVPAGLVDATVHKALTAYLWITDQCTYHNPATGNDGRVLTVLAVPCYGEETKEKVIGTI